MAFSKTANRWLAWSVTASFLIAALFMVTVHYGTLDQTLLPPNAAVFGSPNNTASSTPATVNRWDWVWQPNQQTLAMLQVPAAKQASDLMAELDAYLRQPMASIDKIDTEPFSQVPLTRAQAQRASDRCWQFYQKQIRRDRAAEMKAKQIQIGPHIMPFDYKVFGEAPKSGRSLYISLHGGGGTRAQVNDSQWENQKRLYQPTEGIYLAPRAPTNTWNLWHQEHIDPLFARLIENFVAIENINPNRVFVLGYSAGGDGVYQLAPRMADRWAAASMMAGHPNETSPLGLRNIGFTIHMGENDSAYRRNAIAAEWKTKLAKLQAEDTDGYQHSVKIHPGKGHWMNRQDAVALPWMSKFDRDPRPTKIVWKQDDVWHPRFYWLAVDQPSETKRALVTAKREGQKFTIDTSDLSQLSIRFDDTMADLDQPITIVADSKVVFQGKVKRTIATIAQTIQERGDPSSIFTAQAKVQLSGS